LGLTNNKVPVLHILHGYGSIEYNFSFKGFFKWVISRFVVVKTRSKFITVSPSMNLVAAKFYSNSPDEYTSIQNGIDIKKFPLAPKKDIQQHKLYPKILMIGTLTANKGQIKGIDSFQLLLQDFPNAKLNLIGEGEDRLAIEQRIKNLNLESNVEVLGLQTNIQDFLNQGSILWQLSKTEAMPMAVLESMSIGMPVVGFNVRGINDAIVDNKTGFLVPYGDIELVASKTKIILNDPSLYYKFSSNSRKQIIQNYTHDQMIASYEKVMSKLI
jgi:glycosyltransferase involved in cell wall biosynthesis